MEGIQVNMVNARLLFLAANRDAVRDGSEDDLSASRERERKKTAFSQIISLYFEECIRSWLSVALCDLASLGGTKLPW